MYHPKSMRGLPYGFHYCGCDFCCPELEYSVVGGGGEAEKLEKISISRKPLPKDKAKCGDEVKKCYCEIFYRKRGGRRWDLAYPDAKGDIFRKGKRGAEDDHSDDEYEYKVFCVYVVLDDDSDAVYWICPCACSAAKEAAIEGDEKNVTITCGESNDCAKKCSGTCKIFRLKKDEHTAKWEAVDTDANGSATVPKKETAKYLYRCLCVRE
jgi:hypothetical protein